MRAKGPSNRHSPVPPSFESPAEAIAVAVAVAAAARDDVALSANNEVMAVAVAVAGTSMPITGSDEEPAIVVVVASRSIATVVEVVSCNIEDGDIGFRCQII